MFYEINGTAHIYNNSIISVLTTTKATAAVSIIN